MPIMEDTNGKIPSHMGCTTGHNLRKSENDDYKVFDKCSRDAKAKCEKHRFPKLADSPELASTQVFYIPELLEKILLHVPELPLLVFQRVNKIWRDVIRASSPLQRKLFMQAEPINFSDLWVDYDTINFRWNPFVRKYVRHDVNNIVPCPNVDFGCNMLHKFNDPDASWRKMFVSQPAGLTFCLCYSHNIKENLVMELGLIKSGSDRCAGITMDGMATLTGKAHDKRVLISLQIRVLTKGARAG